MIDYSVIIRTTGSAHEKYQKLLSSIEKLIPQPKEIIVVLPEGSSCPDEKLEWETYYFSPKGMVIQRMTGIDKCKTRYALVCDDDIQFESDFVQKLYRPIRDGLCAITAGPLYSFLPPKGSNAMLCAVMGSAVPTVFHKERYVSVLRTTGYSYNRNLNVEKKYYETQSLAWTCFFADIEAIKSLDFMDEIWLDSHGYSALDDQTMFYKAFLRGIKAMVVVDATYEHLDARTSTKNNKEPVLYSRYFNRVVFWHRFIYKKQANCALKLYTLLCFVYRSLWLLVLDVLDVVRHRMKISDMKISCRGYVDGWKYLRTKEYKELPPV
ncbi:MAG: glycosyltransferase [Lachnospiraceae bacterium]|nr:glycosyltransferase [Lachnospiraceae bacterium]